MNMIVSTALTGTAIAPAGASSSLPPDPIYEAIDSHRRARMVIKDLVEEHCGLETSLPKEKRQSSVTQCETLIVQSDDPRWIASEVAVHDGFDREDRAATELVNVLPTTVRGALDLLRYVNSIERGNYSDHWPEIDSTDDGLRTWIACLHANLLTTFDGLSA